MTVKRIISSVFVIGMLLAPLSTYTSYAIEGNDLTDTSSTIFENTGVFYDGDAYKELNFFEGEIMR